MLFTCKKKKSDANKTRGITRDGHCEKEGIDFFYFDLYIYNTRVSYEYAYYILIFEIWWPKRTYTLKNTILLFENLKLKLQIG